MSDPYDLARFVTAQAPVIGSVRAELGHGRKESHWMWFVFPQLAGLGRSGTARHFGLRSLAEARAYLEHPVLGARLRECTALVNAIEGGSALEIFGQTDAMKFRSSMTLFLAAAEDKAAFQAALDKYYGGEPDRLTLALLDRSAG